MCTTNSEVVLYIVLLMVPSVIPVMVGILNPGIVLYLIVFGRKDWFTWMRGHSMVSYEADSGT